MSVDTAPTHEQTSRLYRRLVEVIGQEQTDTLFTLIWQARGRPVIDFGQIYGADDPAA